MKKLALIVMSALLITFAGFSCWWWGDSCTNIYGDVCGCLSDQSMRNVCQNAVQQYMSGPYQGACDLARQKLKPLYCP